MAIQANETTIELKDILAILRRRKWLIILPLILVTAIAFGGTYLLEERYQSSTMILIEQTQYLSRQLRAMIPGQEDGRGSSMQRRSRLIAIHNEINSSLYLSRLIDELQMTQDPEIIQKARKFNASRPDIAVQTLVYHLLIQELRNNIKVQFSGESIIEITAESSDPGESMAIASKLAEIFKDERLKQELSGVRGALDFSDEQLAIYRKNLDDAESARARFQSEFIRNRLDESVVAGRNIRAIMADIDNFKLRLEENNNEQARVRTELANYRQSQLDIDLGSDYNNYKKSIFDETKRLVDFMPKYIWADPKILNANRNISRDLLRMENIVEDEIKRQFPDAPSDEQELLAEFFILRTRETVIRRRLRDYEVSLSTLRNRIALAPQHEIQMRNLVNDVNSARDIYEKFKTQLTGSEISQSLMRGESETKYRIMEPASVPLVPVKPNRVKYVALGAVLGLVLGAAAALLAELLDNSFKKVEDVEQYLSMPVLATIPNISSIKRKIKI